MCVCGTINSTLAVTLQYHSRFSNSQTEVTNCSTPLLNLYSIGDLNFKKKSNFTAPATADLAQPVTHDFKRLRETHKCHRLLTTGPSTVKSFSRPIAA